MIHRSTRINKTLYIMSLPICAASKSQALTQENRATGSRLTTSVKKQREGHNQKHTHTHYIHPQLVPAKFGTRLHGMTSFITRDFTIKISDPSQYESRSPRKKTINKTLYMILLPIYAVSKSQSSHTRERGNEEQSDHHSVF